MSALQTEGRIPRLGGHAVVIGGSIAGLLAARVLSDYFDRVAVVERDAIPRMPQPRKGVPHGHHVHTIFGGGVNVIERLFPGLFEELVAEGAIVCDTAKDLCWYHQGVWKLRTPSDLTSYWQTRPFLEAHIRRRTQADRDIHFLEACEVMKLLSNPERTRIVGVEVQHRGQGGRTEQLPADLVVDAAGRGSRTPHWLQSLGHDRPEESTVEVHIGYASRLYERPEQGRRDWQILAVYGTPPNHTRTGYLFPVEGGRWLATAVGFFQDYPPDDEAGFLEFARAMEMPDFYEAIKDAKPLTPIVTFRFPAHRWRHYERLARPPGGLLVLGDAFCSFNPVYGQGMSTCALQVDLLDRMLRQCGTGAKVPADFAKQFFQRVAKIVANPWLLATTSDFLYPQTGGRRPFGTKLLRWYITRVFELCAWDKSVLLCFYRVLNFLDEPTVLFRPSMIFHVLMGSLRFRGRDKRLAKRRPLLAGESDDRGLRDSNSHTRRARVVSPIMTRGIRD
jgi:2-polyprenyl-6-methoxyphenol hydroxylase-like FAD-dependent oxidoreductase